MMKEDYYKKC